MTRSSLDMFPDVPHDAKWRSHRFIWGTSPNMIVSNDSLSYFRIFFPHTVLACPKATASSHQPPAVTFSRSQNIHSIVVK